MRIDFIVCPEHIEEKLRAKHLVTCREARQVLLSGPRIRFMGAKRLSSISRADTDEKIGEF
jgi:hypothetical protein